MLRLLSLGITSMIPIFLTSHYYTHGQIYMYLSRGVLMHVGRTVLLFILEERAERSINVRKNATDPAAAAASLAEADGARQLLRAAPRRDRVRPGRAARSPGAAGAPHRRAGPAAGGVGVQCCGGCHCTIAPAAAHSARHGVGRALGGVHEQPGLGGGLWRPGGRGHAGHRRLETTFGRAAGGRGPGGRHLVRRGAGVAGMARPRARAERQPRSDAAAVGRGVR